MQELQKTLELAEISFEGENYQDSYKKYTEAVELDMSNVKGWIGKALSSAHLADPNGNKFKEASVCLKKAVELEIDESQKETIASHIVLSTNSFIEKILKIVDAAIIESEKKPMATGELYAVRNIGLLADRMGAFINQWDNFKLAIDFSKTAFDYKDDLEESKKVLTLIDNIYEKSTANNAKPKFLGELANYRSEITTKIKEFDPNYSIPAPKNNDGGGCFIATAVYGDYNAPEVIELRDFRDSYLSKYHLGKEFIKFYYQFSPFLASIISRNNLLKLISRVLIVKPVSFFWLKIKGNENK